MTMMMMTMAMVNYDNDDDGNEWRIMTTMMMTMAMVNYAPGWPLVENPQGSHRSCSACLVIPIPIIPIIIIIIPIIIIIIIRVNLIIIVNDFQYQLSFICGYTLVHQTLCNNKLQQQV